MLRRIMIFLTSILLLLNSALVNASIGGWTLSNPTAVGASILYDGTKGSASSSILISPNASQVAKVLRGGLVGYALTFAVEQLLGAVDWVLDPDNNQVIYNDHKTGFLYNETATLTFNTYLEASNYCKTKTLNPNNDYVVNSAYIQIWYGTVKCIGRFKLNNAHTTLFEFGGSFSSNQKKTLSLITAAQQVIENAESDNLDAQFAVLAATINILSEAEQDDAKAKPFEDELERNADDKCKDHNFKMDSQAAIVEWRYNELIADRYNLFINNKSVSNPLILNGVNKGSWDGHVDQYKYAQGVLRNFITKASNAGCPATPRADKWVNIEPPSQPGSSL
jgi:hypothetical protein